MNYPKPILFKVERVFGFLLFVIGGFALLKLLGIFDETLIVPNQYLAWFTAAACLLIGFILMSHKQHGIY